MKMGLPSWVAPFFFVSFSARARLCQLKNFFDFLKIPLDILVRVCYTIIVPREWARRYESPAGLVGRERLEAFGMRVGKAPSAVDALVRIIITVTHRCRQSAQSKKSVEAAKIFSIFNLIFFSFPFCFLSFCGGASLR